MNALIRALTCATLLGVAGGAHAGIISFDFATGPGSTQGPHSVTVNGVIASAFDNGGAFTPDLLWYRNQTNDHGLGVCNARVENCGPGDLNELDNVDSLEVIILENTNGGKWTSLWVSSLDGNEKGTVFWYNDFAVDFDLNNSFSYTAGVFAGGVVEGDILALPAASAAGFDPTASHLLFIAGDTSFEQGDNDYLIWKGTVRVPEPGTLGLLGLSMVVAGFASRRRRAC